MYQSDKRIPDKRLITLLLALAIAAVSASCTQTAPSVDGVDTSDSDQTAPVDETTIDPLSDQLPDADYEGYTFKILGADVDIPMLLEDEMTGSLVSDAVYNANLAVEDRFNVTLEQVKLSDWSDSNTIKSMILSGADDFDLGVCHDITAGNLSLEGLFLNLYDLPHLDFSKPWWPEFTVDGLTVNDQMYLFSNYIGYNGLRGTKTMYVNLDKLEDYDLESPYDLVRSGDWTLDRVITMTKDVYSDLDGDQKPTRDDFYGFAFTGLFYGWLENFGIEAYTHTADHAGVELSINSERTSELITKIKKWLYGGNSGVYYQKSHTSLYNPDSYAMMFADGKSLYTYGSLYVLISCLSNSTVTYGILPMPKYDANQADYYGVCYDSPMWVPASATNTERTGVILEAMSAQGYKQIMPAYKDIALKNRYAIDTDSAEMLDIIFKNRVLSFSYIYGKDDGFQRILNDIVPSDTNEFSSYYAANEAKQLDRIAAINSFFSK